jgi:hypothetical protein
MLPALTNFRQNFKDYISQKTSGTTQLSDLNELALLCGLLGCQAGIISARGQVIATKNTFLMWNAQIIFPQPVF